MAVTFEQTVTGYLISREFRSLAAAAAGAAALEGVAESGFIPVPQPTASIEFEADPKLQAMVERADEDAPLEHLRAGQAYMADMGPNPTNQRDEE